MAARMSPPNSATGPPEHLDTGSSGHLATWPLDHPATRPLSNSATRPLGHSAIRGRMTMVFRQLGHSAGPLGLSQLFSVMSGHVSTHAHFVGVLMDVGAQRFGVPLVHERIPGPSSPLRNR